MPCVCAINGSFVQCARRFAPVGKLRRGSLVAGATFMFDPTEREKPDELERQATLRASFARNNQVLSTRSSDSMVQCRTII